MRPIFLLTPPALLKSGDQILHQHQLWEVRRTSTRPASLNAGALIRGPTALPRQDRQEQYVLLTEPVGLLQP